MTAGIPSTARMISSSGAPMFKCRERRTDRSCPLLGPSAPKGSPVCRDEP
jgi:hypothetical protein